MAQRSPVTKSGGIPKAMRVKPTAPVAKANMLALGNTSLAIECIHVWISIFSVVQQAVNGLARFGHSEITARRPNKEHFSVCTCFLCARRKSVQAGACTPCVSTDIYRDVHAHSLYVRMYWMFSMLNQNVAAA